mmetsp:Transcript_30111/g.71555  ORF Transcript_30111/g.71555 Transcript_30111/m.71555 type:complete len:204 (+) Transcript_30111:274-885(+)
MRVASGWSSSVGCATARASTTRRLSTRRSWCGGRWRWRAHGLLRAATTRPSCSRRQARTGCGSSAATRQPPASHRPKHGHCSCTSAARAAAYARGAARRRAARRRPPAVTTRLQRAAAACSYWAAPPLAATFPWESCPCSTPTRYCGAASAAQARRPPHAPDTWPQCCAAAAALAALRGAPSACSSSAEATRRRASQTCTSST